MQCGLNIQGSLRACDAPGATQPYATTIASTIAWSAFVTGFAFNSNDWRPNSILVESVFKQHGQGRRPFCNRAVAVITQLGAFSLQFRSRSGCVFVARWRSGLTIGRATVPLAPVASPRLPPVYEYVLQKKRNNFIWQRRDATPEAFVRFPCLCL